MKKGIYVIPTLITAFNIALGFRSILFSIEGKYSKSAWAILIAILVDSMDGRIARWTNTESLFGIQMDSLADSVSFGLAPALMFYLMQQQYQLALGISNDWMMVIALGFFIAAVFRLARFNLCSISQDKTGPDYYFSGLPVPGAAGVLSSLVIVYTMFEMEITRKTMPVLMKQVPQFFYYLPVLMMLLAYLMISNLRYSTFKNFKFRGQKSRRTMILIMCGVFLLWKYPENMLLILSGLYLISGILDYIIRLVFLSRRKTMA